MKSGPKLNAGSARRTTGNGHKQQQHSNGLANEIAL
jgi:hypothetical protein